MKKVIVLALGLLSIAHLFGANPTITAVTAQQRYPWNGLVDIAVTFSGTSNDVSKAVCTFSATDGITQTALAISHIERLNDISGSGSTWTRHYVWDAAADVGEVKITDVALNVSAEILLGGVQLWANGPCWAECNVGATKPEEYGYYFWWGDTVGYERNSSGSGWVSVQDGSSFYFTDGNCQTYGQSNSQLESLGYINSTDTLVAAHDAATVHLGAPWRMPTSAEIDALIKNCTTTWITTNGVYGRLVTGKGSYASKSIFFPAAGLGSGPSLTIASIQGGYWSSTPCSDNSSDAWYLAFNPEALGLDYYYCRSCGQSVRPLRDFSRTDVIDYTTHLTLDCRTNTRYARIEEPIAFSTDWSENVTRLVLNVDGSNVLTTTSATNGIYLWKPDFTTSHTASLWLMTRGATTIITTATFQVEAFDVTLFSGAHGTFANGAKTEQRIPYGSDAVLPIVQPEAGYAHSGWSAATTNVTNDVKATALYTVISYPITYTNLYGATNQNPPHYTVEDAITFVAPGSVSRRKFVRWEPASLDVGTTDPQIVSAIWEETPFVFVDAQAGDDAQDGSSTNSAVRTLMRAYELSLTDDIIYVATGTYSSVTATGKAVTFRAQSGATIDGSGESRCVTADADVVFENFTIRNGYDFDAGGGVYGGCFTNCTICSCRSDLDGGGAYNATLTDCLVVSNATTYGFGGGVFGGKLINCRVVDNTAGDIGGGAYAPDRIVNTTFSGNSPENVSGDDGMVTAGTSFVYAPPDSETAYSIPYDWFVTKGLAKIGDATSGLDTKLAATQVNGWSGWESFVAGLDPTNAASQFTATITLSNGMVYVGWAPDLNEDKTARVYIVHGRTELGSGDWETPANDGHNFFKVEVAMPEGGAVSDVPGPLPEKPLGGVQLWENGPYWAECNVGATKPEAYGYYFWWGDTVGYVRGDGTWNSFYSRYEDVRWVSSDGVRMSSSPFWWAICPTYDKDNSTLQSLGYIGSDGNLVSAHDAATVHLGKPWRMPTSSELNALEKNCTTTYITTNGIHGRLVKGKGDYATRSIFLPMAGYGVGYEDASYLSYPNLDGYCWSSTPYADSSGWSWGLRFEFGTFDSRYDYERFMGRSVRPVRDSGK